MFELWTIARFGIALVAALVLYLIGAALVRNFNAEPPPDEPDVATLEDVDYRFRCIVCGAQVVMYTAQGGEVPDPPRHCREPMVLMAPVDDTGRQS
ncbi:MAG TPA: hypothetical protein VH914_16800 [Acidimicrobiia bacterium]|jgi:hypothetical protein|nr:hypothetical protein [Acidimicrobiia bacterium]